MAVTGSMVFFDQQQNVTMEFRLAAQDQLFRTERHLPASHDSPPPGFDPERHPILAAHWFEWRLGRHLSAERQGLVINGRRR